jgi:hypothetical protein
MGGVIGAKSGEGSHCRIAPQRRTATFSILAYMHSPAPCHRAYIPTRFFACRSRPIGAIADEGCPSSVVSIAMSLSSSLASTNAKAMLVDQQYSKVNTLSPGYERRPSHLVIGLVCVQVLTLTGSLVGGHLARKRRLEIERINVKLRQVLFVAGVSA